MKRLFASIIASFQSFLLGSPQSQLATDAEKAQTTERIETGYLSLHESASNAVDLLYAEAKSKYDAGCERYKALDAKAGTLITIVTTGFGAFAILGDPAKLGPNPWVVVGLLALALAFVCAVIAQLPRDVQFPELSLYVSVPTVSNRSNAIRIKYELVRSWVRDADANDQTCVTKKRLLDIATTLLGIGLAALTLNYTLPPAAEKPIPTVRVILQPTSAPAPR
jgi:hypothetical protein